MDGRFKYFHRTPWGEFFLRIEENNWEALQFVSLNEYHEVIGYLATKVDRLTKTGYDIEIMHFEPTKNPVFTQDLYNFFSMLYSDYGLNRLVWNVVVGNPVEAFYDRLVDNFGVRIVGTFKDEVLLRDGQLCDLKYYEYFKADFLKQTHITGLTYRDFNKGVG